MATSTQSEPRASVLVVDDEPTIGEVVARYLERAGYNARVATDGPQALALSAASPPDLVVLDVMLPGIDGLEVMRRLREPGSAPAPCVILLTARGREAERIVGLRRGADDYVVKPFSPGELVARVEAVLRRDGVRGTAAANTAADDRAPALEFDGLRIEPASRRVFLGALAAAPDDGKIASGAPDAASRNRELAAGALDVTPEHGGIVTGQHTAGAREVSLTAREFELLAFLARHPGQVFSRDRLMELVWQLPDYTDSSTVTVHIRRLRAKIEPDPERPRFIQTVWGVGYRFQP